MTEIPEVYGVWPEPACCGDPGDCAEPCAHRQPRWETILPIVVDPRMPPGFIGVRLMTRKEIESRYGPPITP